MPINRGGSMTFLQSKKAVEKRDQYNTVFTAVYYNENMTRYSSIASLGGLVVLLNSFFILSLAVPPSP